jgi:mannose-6-phosphate isomerase-like protein (cupin superfamily)
MPLASTNTAQKQDFGLAVQGTGHLDGYTVQFVTIRETHSLKDMLAGLPGSHCRCPHWGYMLSGRMTVDYDHEQEEYGPGDAFFMPPGHVPTAEAGSEFVIFSPKDELAATEAAVQEWMQRQQP